MVCVCVRGCCIGETEFDARVIHEHKTLIIPAVSSKRGLWKFEVTDPCCGDAPPAIV